MHLNPILSLGIIFLSGFFVSRIIQKVRIPQITGDLLLGILIGEEFLNLISNEVLSASSFISNIVLGLIAFTIGQSFYFERFKRIGRSVLFISLFEAIGAWLIVMFGFYFLLGTPLYVAILFGAIASATAPAATVMVIRQYRASGIFTNILLGVVAIDDAWCLIIFSISLALAKVFHTHALSTSVLLNALFHGAKEIIGALGIGFLMGMLFKFFSRFIKTESGLEIYTLGFILLTIGIAIELKLSVLLSAMALGTTVVNVLKGDEKFFAILKMVEQPLYLLFFVLAGANLEIASLKNIGKFGIAYLILRVLGKVIGARIGGILGKVSDKVKKYIGFALIPQAGVALGVALIIKADYPHLGSIIFDTVVGTTVIYEILGPIFTKYALTKAGEIKR